LQAIQGGFSRPDFSLFPANVSLPHIIMKVLSFPEARGIVEEHARRLSPLDTEVVPLLNSLGRVLQGSVVAERDMPPFDRATRDGYAVNSSDLAEVPSRLQVIGEIKAGAAPELLSRHLQPGEAFEIMTGAPLPPGADAVVMVEYTASHQQTVEIHRSIVRGENFVPRGAETRAGTEVLAEGTRMGAAAVAMAASQGCSQLRVFAKPQVTILATGDEIIELTDTPGPTQIRNSNSFSLAAQVTGSGGVPIILPVAADDLKTLRDLISRSLTAHLLLLSGGVSMGKHDLVEGALQELGAEFFFTGAMIQPGKPIVFGRIPAKQFAASRRSKPAEFIYFLGMPGNPVSTMVNFELFARPLLDALAGAPVRPLTYSQVRLKTEITTATGLTRFFPGLLTGQYASCEVESIRWQGSGDIAAASRANCYIVIPPDRERIAAGEYVSVLLNK
jgi:molybdopterin molybdotransferase